MEALTVEQEIRARALHLSILRNPGRAAQVVLADCATFEQYIRDGKIDDDRDPSS